MPLKPQILNAWKKIRYFLVKGDFLMWLVWALCIAVAVTLAGLGTGVVRDLKGYMILIPKDLAFLTLPFWLLPRKYKYWTVPLLWALSLLLIANALYFKYWHDMLSLSQAFVSENFNGFVFGSIGPLWGSTETWIVFVSLIYTAAYIFYFRHHRHTLGWKPRLLISLVSIIIGFSGVLAQVARNRAWYLKGASYNITYGEVFKRYYSETGSNVGYFQMGGFSRYLLAQAIELLQPHHLTLSESQKAEIEEYLKRSGKDVFEPADSVPDFSANRDKNLIFIIVESLNSEAVGKRVNGRSVTPTLDSLISSPGTFYCLDMITQIRAGGSSDGQMIYNSGLLPLENGSAILKFADNKNFVGLPEILKRENSVEFICESSTVWRHRESSAAYGYEKIYDKDSFLAAGIDPDVIGDDRAVFSYALDRMKTMKQPFMAEITTLSMHFPYLQKGFDYSAEFSEAGQPSEVANYNSATHFFDIQLSEFIAGLKLVGLYENSVIVIASDHEFKVVPDNPQSAEVYPFYSPIVLMVINGGVEGKYSGAMGQIDVYPSIIDLMGGDSVGKGLGHSIFRYKVNGSLDAGGRVHGNLSDETKDALLKARKVSDLIIRSDYPYLKY